MSICGGIPTLAFAYINGKIKFSNHGKTPSEKQKRTVFRWLAFLLGSFMGCFLFPTYNFTKTYPNGSHWYSVYLWPAFAFTGESGYTHSPSPTGSHTAAHTPKHGPFGRGWYHYPRSVLRGSETLRGQVSERRTLPLWDLGREVLSKNAESLRDSDAPMRVAVPKASRPRWAA